MARSVFVLALAVVSGSLLAASCGDTEPSVDGGPPLVADAEADASADGEVDAATMATSEDPCLDAKGMAATSPWPMRGGCPRRPGSRMNRRGPQSGTLLFTYPTTARATAPVITEGGMVVVGTDDGHVIAMSPTGQKQWDVTVGRSIGVSPFVRDADEIVVATRDGRLLRLATADGSERGAADGASEPSELLPLADGLAYTAADGKLHRTDANLREVSVVEVKSKEGLTLAKDGALLAAGEDGVLRRVDPSNGAITELFRAPAALTASPTVTYYGDIVVVGKDEKLRSLDAKGVLRFERPLGSAPVGPPACSPDGAAYVATAAGKVVGFDRAGQETVSFAPLGLAEPPIVGAQGTIYFGAEDTKLYAVQPSGRLLFAGALRVRARSSPALADNGALFLAVEGGVAGVGP